jgi:putative flippase GtrA
MRSTEILDDAQSEAEGGPDRRYRRVREFITFAFFGAINTAVTYGVYVLCVRVIPYNAAYTISYAFGIVLSYWLNARFVFGERLRISRALQYPIVYAVQYLVGLAVLYVAVEVAGLNKYVAPLLVVVLTLPVTYVLSRYVIKRPARR